MKQFTFTSMTVNIANVKIHAIVESMGCDTVQDETFKRDFQYFSNYYDKPVAVQYGNNYHILNHVNDFKELLESGVEAVEIYLSNFDCEFDVRRFIGFRHLGFEKNLAAVYETINYIKRNRKTKEGSAFMKSIPGKDYADKIGTLMGTSGSTVGRIQKIGDKAPGHLHTISKGESTIQDGLNEATKIILMEKAALKKEKDKDKPKTPTQKEFHKNLLTLLQSFNINLEDKATPFVELNNKEFNSLEIIGSTEIKGGKGRIVLKDNKKEGLIIKLEVQNYYESNARPLDKKYGELKYAS